MNDFSFVRMCIDYKLKVIHSPFIYEWCAYILFAEIDMVITNTFCTI